MGCEFEKPEGNEPVYIQLVRQVKARIASGRLRPGDALPSRRELAVTLEINPNTVQKAYKLLEDEGLLSTGRSSHSVISADEAAIAALRRSEAGEAAKDFSRRMKELGFGLDEAVRFAVENWEE